MSPPRVLLVDDSDVILSFGRAALSGHYTVSSASNGRQALEQVRRARPAAVVLDLSMPEMGGMEVLRAVRADPDLAATPIIILSSEDHRRDECLGAGADEFLAKPVRAADLLATVNRIIALSDERAQRGGLAILALEVGELEFALPLASVSEVVFESATIAVPAGLPHLNELIDLRGTMVLVLDTAVRLGTRYLRAPIDRVFVVLAHEGRRFCLRADGVRDPEVIAPAHLSTVAEMGGGGTPGLRALLRAIARTDRGIVPILDAAALVSGEVVDRLDELIGFQAKFNTDCPDGGGGELVPT